MTTELPSQLAALQRIAAFPATVRDMKCGRGTRTKAARWHAAMVAIRNCECTFRRSNPK